MNKPSNVMLCIKYFKLVIKYFYYLINCAIGWITFSELTGSLSI